MSTIKISQLPAATSPVASTSVVPVVQNGQTVKATLSQIAEMVSVTAFGAIGDDLSDNTVAIQAAIDSLTTGGTLFFPPGTYRSGALTIDNPNVKFLMAEFL